MARRQISTVIASGDRRASLEAIRDKLASELAAAESRDAAILAKELRAVITEIDSLAMAREVSRSDELAARRAARRQVAAEG